MEAHRGERVVYAAALRVRIPSIVGGDGRNMLGARECDERGGDAVFLGQAGADITGGSFLGGSHDEHDWNGMAIVPIPTTWREASSVKALRLEVEQFLAEHSLHLL